MHHRDTWKKNLIKDNLFQSRMQVIWIWEAFWTYCNWIWSLSVQTDLRCGCLSTGMELIHVFFFFSSMHQTCNKMLKIKGLLHVRVQKSFCSRDVHLSGQYWYDQCNLSTAIKCLMCFGTCRCYDRESINRERGKERERQREGGSAKCIRASEKRALWNISGLLRRGFRPQHNERLWNKMYELKTASLQN